MPVLIRELLIFDKAVRNPKTNYSLTMIVAVNLRVK